MNKAYMAGNQTASQPSLDDMPEGEVCIANISPAQRMKRLRFAIVSGVGGLVVLAALLALNVSPWWRLALFPIVVTAAICYFEWRDKTCVKLAMDNTQFIGDREEKVEDLSALAQMKRQSNRVFMKSIPWALVITLLTLIIPGAW